MPPGRVHRRLPEATERSRKQGINKGRASYAPERHSEVLQPGKGLWIYLTGRRWPGCFRDITAVQRSGIPELSENMKISFEVQPDKRGRGPQAVNLQIV